MQISGRSAEPNHDIAVARRERRLALLAVIATGTAMLATSPPPEFFYTFQKSVKGPPAALSADAPRARFLVTLRATELAPNGAPTTQSATANVRGAVEQHGGARFVTARVTGHESATGSELTVLGNFALPMNLEFDGECETLSAADPCQASFLVELERSDRGETGAVVDISWEVELSSRASKESPDEGPLELPWSVEITPQ